jgi:hypothetical protein
MLHTGAGGRRYYGQNDDVAEEVNFRRKYKQTVV